MTLDDLLMMQRDLAHCKDVFGVNGVVLKYVAPTAVDILELCVTGPPMLTARRSSELMVSHLRTGFTAMI